MRSDSRSGVQLFNRRLEKPLLAPQASMDGTAFIKAVFRIIRNTVECDFVSVCVRFMHGANGIPVCRIIDSRGIKFEDEHFLEVFFNEHPGMPLFLANPGIRFINTREVLPPDELLHQTRFYTDAMQIVGFRHAVGMFFWDEPPQFPEAIFSAFRGEGKPDFGDREVAALDRLWPHIDAAFRRIRFVEAERGVRSELRAINQQTPRATCILDAELRLADASKAGRESCAGWSCPASQSRHLKTPPFELPRQLRDACHALKSEWQRSLSRHATAIMPKARLVVHATRPGLRASVALDLSPDTPLGKPRFLIVFQLEEKNTRSRITKLDRDESARRLAQLSTRDRELVHLVCKGRGNNEIADTTGRALGTVKNSLHFIFKKVGVQSRAELAALGHHYFS